MYHRWKNAGWQPPKVQSNIQSGKVKVCACSSWGKSLRSGLKRPLFPCQPQLLGVYSCRESNCVVHCAELMHFQCIMHSSQMTPPSLDSSLVGMSPPTGGSLTIWWPGAAKECGRPLQPRSQSVCVTSLWQEASVHQDKNLMTQEQLLILCSGPH